MQHVLATPLRGHTLRPTSTWNGSKDHVFNISGRADTDYAKDPDTRRSITGTRVLLDEAVTHWRSNTQKSVTLSVTESEQSGAVTCAQDML